MEHYDATGRLLRVVQRNGWTNTLGYSDATTPAAIAPRPGLLISVRNHFGRELRFSYDAAGRLAELLPPGAVSGTPAGSAASPIRYMHNEPASLGAGVPGLNQPTGVVWQDGAVRRYHYENAQFPQWLTGRTDELGVRIGSYSYNTSGQLERSAGPSGMNTVDFVYRGSTTEITDRSGATPTTSTYTWEEAAGVIRPTAISAPCAQCGSTSARTAYTATSEVARQVGHDGRITFYAYDTNGRETERATYPATYNSATTRPALNLAERVVSTKWHATWNLPTLVAEPGKTTAYTYGTGGRLTGESWTATTDATGAVKFAATASGSTYAAGYSYNAKVQPSTIIDRVDGIEARRWTYVYNAVGDLTKVTTTEAGVSNVLTVTPAAQHGQIAGLSAANGAAAQFTYDLRTKLRTAQLTDWGATFEHDTRSLLQEVRFGTGAWVRLIYDASGVPIRVDESTGSSQQIAGLEVTSNAGEPYPTSRPWRALLGTLRAAAAKAQTKMLTEWLPLPAARAQPVPPAMPANALAGLSRVTPGLGPASAEAGAAQGGGCCGEAARTIARAIEEQIKGLTTPMVLVGIVAADASQAVVDDLLLLRARSRLRKNMLCDKAVPIPAGCFEAHHIVAFLAPAAQPARDILAQPAVNIGIDSPINGVWLQCAAHRKLHTSTYYASVNLRLQSLPVKNTATVMATLRSIAAEIQAGTF